MPLTKKQKLHQSGMDALKKHRMPADNLITKAPKAKAPTPKPETISTWKPQNIGDKIQNKAISLGHKAGKKAAGVAKYIAKAKTNLSKDSVMKPGFVDGLKGKRKEKPDNLRHYVGVQGREPLDRINAAGKSMESIIKGKGSRKDLENTTKASMMGVGAGEVIARRLFEPVMNLGEQPKKPKKKKKSSLKQIPKGAI